MLFRRALVLSPGNKSCGKIKQVDDFSLLSVQPKGYRELGQEAEGEERRVGQPHQRHHLQWKPPDQARHHP